MNEIARQGLIIGNTLKYKGVEKQAKKIIEKALSYGSTYNDKLHCIIKLSDLADVLIPIQIIEEENKKDINMFLLGLINGLNKSINNVVTIKEASKIVNRDVSNINRAISSGKLIEGIDCRKSGTTWLIEKDALLKVFKIKE